MINKILFGDNKHNKPPKNGPKGPEGKKRPPHYPSMDEWRRRKPYPGIEYDFKKYAVEYTNNMHKPGKNGESGKRKPYY